MSDEVKTEMVEKETQEEPKKEPIAEVDEIIDDDFDKERAMDTIKKLREFEKKSKTQEKKLLAYEEAEKQRKEADLSEAEKAKKRADEAESKLKELEIKEQRRTIAEEIGLPVEFADRIRGETPEDMKADAQAFLDKMPKVPKISTTNPGENANGRAETDIERLHRIRSGGEQNIFDIGSNRQRGGGVILSTTTSDKKGVVEKED